MVSQSFVLLYDIHYLAQGGECAIRTGIGRTCLGILRALRLRNDIHIELISSAGCEEQATELVQRLSECAGLPFLRFTEQMPKAGIMSRTRQKCLRFALTQGKRFANYYAPQLSRKLFAQVLSSKKIPKEEIERRQKMLSQRYAGQQVWFFSVYGAIPEYVLHIPKVSTSVMVQDIIPLRLPQYRGASEKLLALLHDGAFRADHILANSAFTKQDFLSCFPQIPENKVTPVLLGHDSVFIPPSEQEITQIRTRLNIPAGYRYIHVVSSLEPRKGLMHVVSCFTACLQRGDLEKTLLIITGAKEWGYAPLLQASKKYKEKILFTGSLRDDELISLLGGCSCFVFMSEYEGFGLPVVEAMACGAPVVAANATSLPEVAGDAAILVDLHDRTALESALISVCNDAELQASLRKKSLARASELTWEQTAGSLIATLKSVSERMAS